MNKNICAALLCSVFMPSLYAAHAMMKHPDHKSVNLEDMVVFLSTAQMYEKRMQEDQQTLQNNVDTLTDVYSKLYDEHEQVKQLPIYDEVARAQGVREENGFKADYHTITAYELRCGKVTHDNPINKLTEYTLRLQTQLGTVCEEYKKMSVDKDAEREKLAQQLKMTKLLLISRLKKIVIATVAVGLLCKYPWLLPQGEYTSGAFKAYVHMLQTVAAVCGNAVAENIHFVFNLSAQLLLSNPQILIASLAAGAGFVLSYLAGTYTLWRDTHELPVKIAELENSKDCAWKFVKSYNEYRPLVVEHEIERYSGAIKNGPSKTLAAGHLALVDMHRAQQQTV